MPYFNFLRFRRDCSGGIAMTAAVLMLPLLLVTGSAVEMYMIARDRQALQSATDAAALAGAASVAGHGQQPNDTDQSRRKRAADFLLAQTKVSGLPEPVYTINASEERVEVSARLRHGMIFKILGDSIEIAVKAVAVAPPLTGQALDVVMCIDVTSSMPNAMKAIVPRATSFADDVIAAAAARGLGKIDQVRVKIIAFSDLVDAYISDRLVFDESEFFTMPDQSWQFRFFLAGRTSALDTGGGGDGWESSLECLYKAMKSKWMKPGDKLGTSGKTVNSIMPLIILWTDADAKPLDDARSRNSPQNPVGMPDNDRDFAAVWNDPATIDQKNKMLALFTGITGPCTYSSVLSRSALSLPGAICAGGLTEGTTNLIDKIVASIARQSKTASAPRLAM